MCHPGFGVRSKIRWPSSCCQKTVGMGVNGVQNKCLTEWQALGVIGGGKVAILIVKPMPDLITTRFAILFVLN